MDSRSDPDPVGRVEARVAVGIAIAAVALHVVRCLHAGGLWRDEVAALEVARSPTWAELWGGMTHELMPVLPIALFRVFGGASDSTLRVLGCVVGVLALAALAWTARATASRAPVVSLLLLGTSSVAVGFGDSIRHYGISMVLVVLLVGATWRVVEAATPGRVAALAVVAVLAVQSAYPNAFLVLGTSAGGAAVLARRKQWRGILVLAACGALAAFSLLPYAGHFRRMAEWAVVVQSDVTVAAVLAKAIQALGSPHALVAGAWALVLAAAAYGAIRLRNDLALFAGVAIGIGTAGYLAWLVRARYVTYDWNYLPLIALLAACGQIAVAALAQSRKARLVVAGACGVLALALAPIAWNELLVRQTNADLLAARMNASVSAGDLVVVNPWYARLSLQRYYQGSAPLITVPPIEPVRWHRYDLVKDRMSAENVVAPVVDAMAKTLQSGHRVWIYGGLHFLGRGVPAPVLFPATRTGMWSSYVYDDGWSSQVAQAILPRVRKSEVVDVASPDPISPIETLPLFVVEGWKDP